MKVHSGKGPGRVRRSLHIATRASVSLLGETPWFCAVDSCLKHPPATDHKANLQSSLPSSLPQGSERGLLQLGWDKYCHIRSRSQEKSRQTDTVYFRVRSPTAATNGAPRCNTDQNCGPSPHPIPSKRSGMWEATSFRQDALLYQGMRLPEGRAGVREFAEEG